MGHPAIDNGTGLAFEALFLVDEEARPVVVPVVKGTFSIGQRGECTRAEEQLPLHLEGETWGDDPEKSSYKYEPEVAFVKPQTDVVLIGHAYAPRPGTTRVDVGFSVGSLRKTVVVFGDRVWFRAAGSVTMSRAVAFERMPLVYERAFGGWDRTHPDPRHQTCEMRNPVGRGLAGSIEQGIPVPNLEDPMYLLASFGERPPPCSFGFVSPHWQPRASLAGTYDGTWLRTRAPRLPKDFDRRHLNAGSPGLIAPHYLQGNEPVTVMGASPEGTLNFALPGLPPPRVRVSRRRGPDAQLQTSLDTVIVEPDERRVSLLWRTHLPLDNGPHDVRAIAVTAS